MSTVGFPEGGDGFYGAGYWARRFFEEIGFSKV